MTTSGHGEDAWGMGLAVLAGMDEADRARLVGIGRRRAFARGQVVCHVGDPADSMHLIASGALSVSISLESGATAMIHVFGPGDFFGEVALIRPGATRVATVTALEATETMALPEPAYRALVDRRPAIHRHVTAMMSRRVDELSTRLFETLHLSLDHRLRARLRDLSRVYQRGSGAVTIPLNQSQIADFTGGTRPSVNQALQRLADQGLVVLARGRVEVPDPSAL